eukprot:857579-Pleurochrysis_carterae.AAC.2
MRKNNWPVRSGMQAPYAVYSMSITSIGMVNSTTDKTLACAKCARVCGDWVYGFWTERDTTGVRTK